MPKTHSTNISPNLLAQRNTHTRIVLGSAALLAALIFAITLGRVPTPFADTQLYASIARSVQLHGIGVPSFMLNSPYAVDHVPFYGPVFFELAALSFRLFGVSIWSFRIVSALGAVLLVSAGALLARQLSASADRWLWALTLLLLMPELWALSVGTMHTMAVGFEILSLAVFVRGLVVERGGLWYGAGAGGLLTLAALTTPRTYPFIVAFIVASMLLPCMPRESRRRARQQSVAAITVLLIGISIWATISHGDPIGWARYMTFILTHENVDVLVLPAATRVWLWSWSAPVTATFAVVGAGIAALTITRRDADAPRDQLGIAAFALLTGWITLVVTMTVMNYIIGYRLYVIVPLFAVVLAMPYRKLKVGSRLLAAGVAALVMCDVGVSAIRYARIGATWAARNPAPVDEFFRTYVPPGSAVMGDQAPYFLAVERSGAWYWTVSATSEADWTRWVPTLEPDATTVARQVEVARPSTRFLVWPIDDDLPDGYGCARGRVVAVYVPAPNHLDLLGPLGDRDVGYPESVLYQLPPDCPTGYDPSDSRRF